jgi:predicted NBD/HSP70 family sugar kinase
MAGKTTTDAQLALLLPMAVMQGWTVRTLAERANIGSERACELLRNATKHAKTAIESIAAIDALSLTFEIGGKTRTLGEVQGKMVTGAARSLATLPENPHEWEDRHDKTYRRCQTILRDAKALGLIRFGESDKAGNPPQLRHVDPFMAQNTPGKRGKSDKSPADSASVNDSASPLDGEGADNPPAQGGGEE